MQLAAEHSCSYLFCNESQSFELYYQQCTVDPRYLDLAYLE